MDWIENSQICQLSLPNLHLAITELRAKISKEALKGAYWYQTAMNPSADIRDMSVAELLGVASIHYQRRLETDWFEGSKEYSIS